MRLILDRVRNRVAILPGRQLSRDEEVVAGRYRVAIRRDGGGTVGEEMKDAVVHDVFSHLVLFSNPQQLADRRLRHVLY